VANNLIFFSSGKSSVFSIENAPENVAHDHLENAFFFLLLQTDVGNVTWEFRVVFRLGESFSRFFPLKACRAIGHLSSCIVTSHERPSRSDQSRTSLKVMSALTIRVLAGFWVLLICVRFLGGRGNVSWFSENTSCTWQAAQTWCCRRPCLPTRSTHSQVGCFLLSITFTQNKYCFTEKAGREVAGNPHGLQQTSGTQASVITEVENT
jgi:hypothetical protein